MQTRILTQEMRQQMRAQCVRDIIVIAWAILWLTVFAACVRSAPPEVVKEVVGKTGEPVFFEVKGDASKLAYAPGFDKNDCPVVRLHSDDKTTISFMAFPKSNGKYYVTFWTQGEKEYSQLVIKVIGVTPKPVPPGPIPPPKPKPVPDVNKVDSVWVIVVEDAKNVRTIEMAKFLNDPYWQSLKPKHEYRHYLSTSATAVENGYVAEADKVNVGYPAVIIIDAATNKTLRSFKASTIDVVKSEVGKVVK